MKPVEFCSARFAYHLGSSAGVLTFEVVYCSHAPGHRGDHCFYPGPRAEKLNRLANLVFEHESANRSKLEAEEQRKIERQKRKNETFGFRYNNPDALKRKK